MMKKTSVFGVSGWGTDLDYCDIEWFALEMNKDHSVVDTAHKYCISDFLLTMRPTPFFLRDSYPQYWMYTIKMGTIKDRNGMDLTEAGDIKTRWQEYTEELHKKGVFFTIGVWNAKVGSQETPGVAGKFCLEIRNEAGQRLIEFCQENALVIANTLFQQHKRRLYTWTSPDGYTKIRLIIF